MRNRIALLVLAALVCCCGCSAWKKPTVGWQATGGEELSRTFWRDIKAKRYEEIQRHLAPTYSFVGPHGIRNREQALDFFRHVRIEEYSIGGVEVHPNGPDMVVTYTINMKGTLNGQPLPASPVYVATVFQHTGGEWVVISQAMTPAAQEIAAVPPGASATR